MLRQFIPCLDDPLQISVSWGQDRTIDVLTSQHICSAPPLTEITSAGTTGSCGKFASGLPRSGYAWQEFLFRQRHPRSPNSPAANRASVPGSGTTMA